MADALDPDDESIGEIDCAEVPRYDPPDWISTVWLETELWNVILDDTPGSTDEEIDQYDGFEDPPDVDDDEEDEEEKRRSTFTLLVGMRPLLGELLGGPPIP